MKIFKWFILILFFSCIDVITQTSFYYHSLYFQGGSWMEIAIMDSMKIGTDSNDYTLQFWVSGVEVDTNEAPAFFSLIDPKDNIKLALFRDPHEPSSINTVVNSDLIDTIMNELDGNDSLDWNDEDKFYLISILFSDSLGLKGYVDSTIFLETNDSVIVGDAILMVGTKANEERTILENFWYGYMNEIRLWNTWLSDSTIQFQVAHPDKFSEFYRYTDADGEKIMTYLDSLIGLWRFNLSEATPTIKDESKHGHDGTIYTLPHYSIELSEKGIQ